MTDDCVYLVTEGSYSDYRIVAVYSARELAEEAAKLYDGDVEVYAIDPPSPEHPADMYWYVVSMNKEGEVGRIQRNSIDSKEEDAPWRPSYGFGRGEYMDFAMWARDNEHSVKIANERRVMLIAANLWTTDRETYNKIKAGKIDAAAVHELMIEMKLSEENAAYNNRMDAMVMNLKRGPYGTPVQMIEEEWSVHIGDPDAIAVIHKTPSESVGGVTGGDHPGEGTSTRAGEVVAPDAPEATSGGEA